MKQIHSRFCIVLLISFILNVSLLYGAVTVDQYEERTKLKGAYYEEERVFKASFPRTDIQVTIDHYHANPFMGLTTWASFSQSQKDETEFMVMGDFVLLQDEVNPVMSLFLDHNIEVTALHNHFFYDEPKIYFMHISGIGRLEALSEAVRHVLNEVQKIRISKDTKSATFGSDQVSEKSEINVATIEKILNIKGQAQEGRYKVVVGKKTSLRTCGCTMGKEMGVNSWATFSGNENKAIVNGDFALFENELQPTLKMLREMNINVVAIHNHMTKEDPRVLFVHYWGVGKLEDLALSVKEILNK